VPKSRHKTVKWLFGKEIEIPEEWEVTTLDSITILLTNGFVGKATDHYTESSDGILYIQGYNVKKNGFNFHGIKYVTKEFHDAHPKSQLKLGDLLTIQTGDIGTTTIVPPKLVGMNCHALIISRFNKEIANSNYYHQYFNSEHCKKLFNSIETGTTMKHLNGGDMKKLRIILPPISEQQKIAKVLSNVDNLIDSYDKTIESTKKLKKGLMQTLLTKGIGHKKFKKVPWLFGKEIEIPEEWEVKKLKEISKLQGGYAFKSEDYQEEGILLLKIANVSHGKFKWDEKSFVPKKYWNEHNEFQIKNGDIILAMTRPIISGGLKIAIFNESKNILLNQRVGKFILQNVNSYFFFCIINQKSTIDQIMTKLGESGQPNISSDEIGEIKICHNSNIHEQQKIESILSSVDTKISKLESKKKSAESLKKGLMQKLLTGEIRVKI
jgi:type I restriction enzyme, S subunit